MKILCNGLATSRYFCEYKRKSHYSTKTHQKDIDSVKLNRKNEQDVSCKTFSHVFCHVSIHVNLPLFKVHSNIKFSVELSMSVSQLLYKEQEAVKQGLGYHHTTSGKLLLQNPKQ